MVPARVDRSVERGAYHGERAIASGHGHRSLGSPVEWKISEVSVALIKTWFGEDLVISFHA